LQKSKYSFQLLRGAYVDDSLRAMWWGIVLLVVVSSTLGFLISRAGTSADRAIGRDAEQRSVPKEASEDDEPLNSQSSKSGKAGS
jgi:hypothetical protein